MKEVKDKDLILALDIGTRTVIGIAAEYTEEEELIVHSHVKLEHKKRLMHDGQIHDIEGVAKTVKEIVSALEKDLGVSFTTVSIAAAGRALKTQKTYAEIDLPDRMEFNRNQVDALELRAVQSAEAALNEDVKGESQKYYNVGYSVSKYFLEGESIDSLEGHIGKTLGVEIIATFLPRGVVESLYTVVHRVGLEVGSMTLEPIAAMNVAIKNDLRILNLALVDIGAGTSDIAITREGEIVAYAMTQTAGDELTEELSKQFLLDFKDAEKLKVSLNQESEHTFKNILGIEFKLSTEEILEKLNSVVDALCQGIADKILELNEKPPSAVFLVGGSSQFPKLADMISEKLELQRERVVIRDLSAIDFVKGIEVHTPDFITPVGIAIEGAKEKYKSFIEVKFNGKEVRLFNTDKVQVSDVMLLVGYDISSLLPKHSDEFVFYLNDRKRYLGFKRTQAKISVNGKEANIRTMLLTGDEIEIEEEKETPPTFLKDVVDFNRKVYYEGEEYQTVRSVSINGGEAFPDTIVSAGDKVQVAELSSYGDFLEVTGFDPKEYGCRANGILRENNEIIQDGESIAVVKISSSDAPLKTPVFEKSEKSSKTINLTVNGEAFSYTYSKDKFVFVDLFDYIDIDLSRTQGELILKVNGESADYMMELHNGDKVDARWE